MIRKLDLENFRGFENHILPFSPLTVAVGQNNAGKTTVVEALRLISLVTQRYQVLNYKAPSNESNLPQRLIGVSPSLKSVEIDFDTIFHRYNDPPASITAHFDNNTKITIYIIPNNKIHAVINDTEGKIVKNRKSASNVDLPSVWIMPQVAPLQHDEQILTKDYVEASMSSRLAPLHFRNQLKVKYELFSEFKQIVEDTWPGVQVRELTYDKNLPGETITLHIRNDDFVAEVSKMGHGLQMWLQTMWFLTRAKDASVVILDEPDVYMHADLQRRIIRFLRNRHKQTIITTHSIEIMSEVQPDDILVIDKRKKESCFAGSFHTVQHAINRFGSIQNIHLIKLLNAQKMLLVEGKDVKLLKEFQDKLYPNSDFPLQSIPNMSIGDKTAKSLLCSLG